MKIVGNKKINEAIDLLIEGGVDLKTVLSQNGLIKDLTRGMLDRSLQAEMSEHLGYIANMIDLQLRMLEMVV